jgi:hypothetical protein
MIDPDPVKRPSAKEALLHAWFKSDKGIIVRLLNDNKILCSPVVSNRRVIKPLQLFENTHSNQNY